MRPSLFLGLVGCVILAVQATTAHQAEKHATPSWRRTQTKHLRPVLESVRRNVPVPDENGEGARELGTNHKAVSLGYLEDLTQPLKGQNDAIEKQNPDAVNPPPTDAGTVVNLKCSFGLSNMLLNKGGYIREQVSSFGRPSKAIIVEIK